MFKIKYITIGLWALVITLLLKYTPSNAQSLAQVEQQLSIAEEVLYQDIAKSFTILEQLALVEKTPKQIERYLILEVRIHSYRGEFELAQQKLRVILAMGLSDESLSHAFYLQARLFQGEQKYHKAFDFLKSAIDIPGEFVSYENRVQVYMLAGELNVEVNDFEQAIYFANKALALVTKKGNLQEQCRVHETIAFIYTRMGANDKFQHASEQAIALCEDAKSFVLLVELYAGRAVFHHQRQEYAQQKEMIEKSIALQIETNNFINKLQAQIILLEAYVGLEQWQKAQRFLELIWLDTSTKKGAYDRADLAQIASNIAMAQGDVAKGLAAYKDYIRAQLEVDKNKELESYQLFNSEYNSVLIESNQRLSSVEDKIQALNIENEQFMFWRLMLLSGFVFVFACAGIYTYRSSIQITTVTDDKVDALTNLYHYSHCYEYVTIQKSLLYNPKQQYAMLLMDIDAFTVFIDNFGHDKADVLLQHLAGKLREHFGSYGIVVRLRDDKFIAMVANCSHQQVADLANGALGLLRGYPSDKLVLNLSLNIGWYYDAGTDVYSTSQYDFALHCATTALMQVKTSNRGSAKEFKVHDVWTPQAQKEDFSMTMLSHS